MAKRNTQRHYEDRKESESRPKTIWEQIKPFLPYIAGGLALLAAYFIAQKNNPTRYINFDIPIGKKEEQYVIDTLEKMRVTCIITRFSLSNSPSKILTHFIETQYHPIQESYEFIVWTKNN